MVGKRDDLSEDTVRRIKEKLCKFSREERKQIVKLYKTKSATEIGKIYGVGPQTIQTSLKLECVKIRNMKESQQNYLKHHDERSKKQSEFMEKNNPMNNPEYRKKCSQPREKNPMWDGGKDIICPKCGKTRYLKPSRFKKLMLKGLCWDCYYHSKPKSSLEIQFAEELKNNGIAFEEQIPFHGMFLDFLLPDKKAVEVDGIFWHSKPDNMKRDKRKEQLLKQEGYTLFRFTDKQIKNDINKCISEVLK